MKEVQFQVDLVQLPEWRSTARFNCPNGHLPVNVFPLTLILTSTLTQTLKQKTFRENKMTSFFFQVSRYRFK